MGGKLDGACSSCGSSDAVKHYDDGLYCFSCNKKTWEEKVASLRLKAKSKFVWGRQIPSNAVEIPATVKAHLKYRYFITPEDIENYNMLWEPDLRRVIIPHYNDHGNLCMIHMRSFDQEPKWLSYGDKKFPFKTEGIVGHSKTEVVLVEDILSAVRVGNYRDTIALLGTSLPKSLERSLLQYDSVVIWLDADEAGRNGAAKIYNKLALLTPCIRIHTVKDPKEYTSDRIHQILRDSYSCQINTHM